MPANLIIWRNAALKIVYLRLVEKYEKEYNNKYEIVAATIVTMLDWLRVILPNELHTEMITKYYKIIGPPQYEVSIEMADKDIIELLKTAVELSNKYISQRMPENTSAICRFHEAILNMLYYIAELPGKYCPQTIFHAWAELLGIECPTNITRVSIMSSVYLMEVKYGHHAITMDYISKDYISQD